MNYILSVQSLAFALPAASKDACRPQMIGVHVDGTRTVATNGHVLLVRDAPEQAAPEPMTIPVYTVKDLLALAKKAKAATVEIVRDGLKLECQVGSYSLRAGVLDLPYPDWRALVGRNLETSGAPAFYHPDVYAALCKATAAVSKGGFCIVPNGQDMAPVTFAASDVVGLVMPLRKLTR